MIDIKQAFSLSLSATPDGFEARWTAAPDLPYFEGHFPNHPVLPAVAILDASLVCLRQALSDDRLELRTIVSAKFVAAVEPGQPVRIALRRANENEWLVSWSTDDLSPRRLADLRVGV